jgi:hypothetical protein
MKMEHPTIVFGEGRSGARALWSLGIDASTITYNFEFWNEYVQFVGNLPKKQVSPCGSLTALCGNILEKTNRQHQIT